MAQENKIPNVYLPVDIKETIQILNDAEAGKIFKAILEYADTGNLFETDEKYLQLVFLQLKNAQDKNAERYKLICEKNKVNALQRWKPMKPLENTGENANEYDRMPPHATVCDRMRWLPNKSKSKKKVKENKIKSKNKTKIENKSKINKKEKNIMCGTHNTKKAKSASAPPPHTFDFSFILSLGKEMGIGEDYCKRFYDYYVDVGWVTVKGEPIKDVKKLLRIWFNKDLNKNNKIVERRNIEDDTKRVFGDI